MKLAAIALASTLSLSAVQQQSAPIERHNPEIPTIHIESRLVSVALNVKRSALGGNTDRIAGVAVMEVWNGGTPEAPAHDAPPPMTANNATAPPIPLSRLPESLRTCPPFLCP